MEKTKEFYCQYCAVQMLEERLTCFTCENQILEFNAMKAAGKLPCRFCQGVEAQKEGEEWDEHILCHVLYPRPPQDGPFAVFHAWTAIAFVYRTKTVHMGCFKKNVRIYNGEALQCARCKVVTNDITAERGTLYCMKCTAAMDE